jgi:hypothetical protein
MHSSDSEKSCDDSGAGDDPHRSSAVPNSLLQLQGNYASGSDSEVRVPATPEKEFDEQDGQSPAQYLLGTIDARSVPSRHY